MPKCHECQSEEFTVKAGFYYCDDCGTQSQFHQELEYDTYFGGLESRLNKSSIKVASDAKSGEFFAPSAVRFHKCHRGSNLKMLVCFAPPQQRWS